MTEDSQPHDPRRGSRWTLLVWTGAALLWLTPLAAMQFAREVNWTVTDFAVFGAMLLTAAGAFELLVRQSARPAYRTAAALAVGGGFILVWINLAVGIIGDEGNPANLLYFAVLAIGLLGGLLARFRAGGMVYTLLAMAVAQVAIGFTSVLSGYATWPFDGIFLALWTASAWLFSKAANQRPSTGNA